MKTFFFCPGDVSGTFPSIDTLQPELLSRIAELVPFADLASLRLVDKNFQAAVFPAAVKLRPSKEILPAQLSALHLAFSNVTALDLSGCAALTQDALRTLHESMPRLRNLQFDSR